MLNDAVSVYITDATFANAFEHLDQRAPRSATLPFNTGVLAPNCAYNAHQSGDVGFHAP